MTAASPGIELARADPATTIDAGGGAALLEAAEADSRLRLLRTRVDALLDALKTAADTQAVERLDARLLRIQRHRSRALFSLARVQDDPSLGRRLSSACLRQACP